MKVFDFTNGTKGDLVGDIKRANSTGGWLVVKDKKVFKVTLADAPEGWNWVSGATYLLWSNGEPVGDVPIEAEDFGVEAICFCTGQWQHNKEWQWHVLGTPEWNREACRKGILKATFSHMMGETPEDDED